MKWKRLLPLVLSLSLLSGCGRMYVPAPQPSPGTGAQPVALEAVTPNELVLRLLESERSQHAGENVVLSPLSIEMALGMAANGADGGAKEALKTLLGMDAEQLGALLAPYLQKGDNTLTLANSMWFQTSLKELVDQEFLDTLTEVYAAGEGAFTPGSHTDAETINGWVKEQTRGKIDGIITAENLKADTLAILINALYFDGKWADPFEEWQVSDGKFHAVDGDIDAQFMSQRLDAYFETDQATGFAKAYEEGTEAAAVTAVMVECATAAMPVERQTKQVYLDRPFAFLIRDTGSGQVVFCGVMERV